MTEKKKATLNITTQSPFNLCHELHMKCKYCKTNLRHVHHVHTTLESNLMQLYLFTKNNIQDLKLLIIKPCLPLDNQY